MSIKLDCPRCKTPLKVPNKLAGGYVNCPHCRGRVWVSKDQPAEKPPMAQPAEPPRNPLVGQPPSADPGDLARPGAAVPQYETDSAPKPPPPPAPRKKVARFITAETADSTLHLAADGKLPELQLDVGALKQKQEAKSSSMNPLVLFGVLSISVLLSIMLVLLGPESRSDPNSKTKAQQRYLIERDFFGSGNIDNSALEPYQVLLREAQRAYTRGDLKAQREYYRRVLDMLRAERGEDRKGLTGSRRRDKQLEESISILLSE